MVWQRFLVPPIERHLQVRVLPPHPIFYHGDYIMPTGYTYKVGEGSEESFEAFALRCAKAFGACVMQRDSNAEFPNLSLLDGDTYHKDKLTNISKQIEALNAQSDEDLFADAMREYEESKQDYLTRIEENHAKMLRYKEMRAQALTWEPPTSEHVGLKDFMIEQLSSSIDFDDMGKYYERSLADLVQPTMADLPAYRKTKLADLRKDFEYHEEESNKSDGRQDNRKQWIIDLFDSLNVDVVDDKVVPRT